ncbi:hypothetical protein ACA910_017514 [Epithemia clementina (nom. ined.)]
MNDAEDSASSLRENTRSTLSSSGPGRHDVIAAPGAHQKLLTSTNDTALRGFHSGNRGVKRSCDVGEDDANKDDDEDLGSKLRDIWNSFNKTEEKTDDEVDNSAVISNAIDQTSQLVSAQINEIIRYGMQTFQVLDSLSRAHNLLQDDFKAKTSEIQRLRLADEKQRKMIQNLIHSVETAKAEARDASHQAVVEANLRAELSVAIKDKNEALQSSQKFQAKCSLLSEELMQAKIKLARATQEKIQMERKQRASLSSTEFHCSSNAAASPSTVDCCELKTTEREAKIDSLKTSLAEKDSPLDEPERHVDDSIIDDKKSESKSIDSM